VTNTATFSTKGLTFYFQSARAKIDGKAVSQLVKFIQGAKHSLDVAIYDMRNADVLNALKSMSNKVQLHILYDAGKPKQTAPRWTLKSRPLQRPSRLLVSRPLPSR